MSTTVGGGGGITDADKDGNISEGSGGDTALKGVEVELIPPVPQLGMKVVVVAVKEIKVMMRVKGYTLRYPQLNHLVCNPQSKQPSPPPTGETKGPERPLIKD